MRRNLFPKETLESPESAYTKLNLRDKNAAEDKNRQTPRNLALFVLNFYVGCVHFPFISPNFPNFPSHRNIKYSK